MDSTPSMRYILNGHTGIWILAGIMTSSVVIKIDSHSNSLTVWVFIYNWFPKYEVYQPVTDIEQYKRCGEQEARHSVYIPGFFPVFGWREREAFPLTGRTLCLWWTLKDKTIDMFYRFYMFGMLKSNKKNEVLFKLSINYTKIINKLYNIHLWPKDQMFFNFFSICLQFNQQNCFKKNIKSGFWTFLLLTV